MYSSHPYNPDIANAFFRSGYPHNMKMYNLCRMKFIGVDKWTEEACEIRKLYFEGKFLVGKVAEL